MGWAHPRWRGEDRLTAGTLTAVAGSSPLARGGLGDLWLVGVVIGLIPAGAGRTVHGPRRGGAGWAHPRWRGEDGLDGGGGLATEGSSPLARGGPAPTTKGGRTTRLIPAGAGRTTRATTFCSICRAHPRWRGEDRHPTPRIPVRAGSSPLARGGLPADAHDHAQRRLIPAGAGRTENVDQRVIGTGAHPRWRGEDRLGGDFFLTGPGSSPLARGGPARPAESSARRRLIPAGAGRTDRHPHRRPAGPAHPRWRGEDRFTPSSVPVANGSSPLARGGHLQSCSFESLNPILGTTRPWRSTPSRANDGPGGHF